MCYVYILQSQLEGRYYIGSSKDVKRRLMEHNAGKVSYSRKFRPWNLVFCQKFADIKTANVVESKLKRWKRRDYLEKVIRDGYIRAIPTPT